MTLWFPAAAHAYTLCCVCSYSFPLCSTTDCFAGLITGLGKGIVGAVAQPVSGGLDFVSSTIEGFDATSNSLLGRSRPQAAKRVRLPRAIGGDHKLLPFIRSDATESQVSMHVCTPLLWHRFLLNQKEPILGQLMLPCKL